MDFIGLITTFKNAILHKTSTTLIFFLIFSIAYKVDAYTQTSYTTKNDFENAIKKVGLDTTTSPGNLLLNSINVTNTPSRETRKVAILEADDSSLNTDLQFVIEAYFPTFSYAGADANDDVYDFSEITNVSQLANYDIAIVYGTSVDEAELIPQDILEQFADNGDIVVEGVLDYGRQRQLDTQQENINFTLPVTNGRDITYDGTYLWTLDDIGVDKILKISSTDGTVVASYCAPDSVPRGIVYANNTLYISDSNTDKLYALDPSLLTVYDSVCASKYQGTAYNLTDLSPDATSAWGLAYDGVYFYLADSANNHIYQFSISGASLIQNNAWTPTFIPRPASLLRGLAYDGTNLYVADAGTQLIYQMSTADGTVTGAQDPWDGFSADQDITGITFINNELWAFDDEPAIKKLYNLNSYHRIISAYEYFSKGNQSFRTPSTDPKGLAYDGTYFWLVDNFTNKLYKLNASTGATISTCNTPGPEPNGLAYNSGSLFVGDSYNDTIYNVDPATCGTIASFTSPGNTPKGLVHDGTFLWNADSNTDTIYKLNPTTGAIISSFTSPGDTPRGLAMHNQKLWVADETNDKYYEMDTDTGNILHTRTVVELSAEGIAFLGNELWSVDDVTDRIYNVDSNSLASSNFYTPSTNNACLAYDGTYVWTADTGTDNIYKVNIATGDIVNTYASPDTDPRDITWDGANLWLITDGTNKIYKIDPTNGNVITTLNAPSSNPRGIVYFNGDLYTSDSVANKVYKINTSGTVLATYNAPGSSAGTMATNGTTIWLHDKDERVIYELELTEDEGDEGIIKQTHATNMSSVTGIEFVNGSLWITDDYFDKFYDDSTVTEIPKGNIEIANTFTTPYKVNDNFYFSTRNVDEAYYLQRRLTNVPETSKRKILVSSNRGGALIISEERDNGGYIFAMDTNLLGSNYEVSRETVPADTLFLNLLGIQTNPNGVHENSRPTYNDLTTQLNTLVSTYPSLFIKSKIGTASNNEDMYKYTYGTSGKPMLVFVSGIHGNEEHAYIAEVRFMEKLARDYNQGDSIATNIFENYEVVFIPLSNPYGIMNFVRFNNNHVDLNRNFDYNWTAFNSDIKGSTAFSEPESRALRDFILAHKDKIVLVNDAHAAMQITPGMTWAYPLGTTPPTDLASIYTLTTTKEAYRWYEERAGLGRWLTYDRYTYQDDYPYFGNWVGAQGIVTSTNEVQGKLDIGTERMIHTSSWYITHFESILQTMSGKVGKTVFEISAGENALFSTGVQINGIFPTNTSVNAKYGSNTTQNIPTVWQENYIDVTENPYLYVELTLNRDIYSNTSPQISNILISYETNHSPPTGEVKIEHSDTYTNSENVTLNISAQDKHSNTVGLQMKISNDANLANAAWEAYATTKSWELDDKNSDGKKTVYVKFRDLDNVESIIYTDSIILDTEEPSGNLKIGKRGATEPQESIKTTNTKDVTLFIKGEAGDGANINKMAIKEGSKPGNDLWEEYKESKEFTLSENIGNKTIYIKLSDRAGNISEIIEKSVELIANTIPIEPTITPNTTPTPNPITHNNPAQNTPENNPNTHDSEKNSEQENKLTKIEPIKESKFSINKVATSLKSGLEETTENKKSYVVATTTATLPFLTSFLLYLSNILKYLDIKALPSLILGLYRKKQAPWGVVYDTKTKQPIDPAIVTLTHKELNKTYQAITDMYGRYEFFVPAGIYSVNVEKQDYKYPSALINDNNKELVYDNILLENNIEVTDNKKVNFNIPIDPIRENWNQTEKLRRGYKGPGKYLIPAASVIFYMGFLWSIVACFIRPGINTFSMLIIFILMLVFRESKNIFKSWGTIIDTNGKPMPGLIVRLARANLPQFSGQIAVTDYLGRYNFLVGKGTYQLNIDNRYKSPEIKIDKPEGSIGKDITLK